ncbi:MAG: TetR/AcrR family transcriptional regulator [Lentimicrobium sp.]|nr:TetR/AcrR family transcriptional regulator [Lentimicrobium sp.]
MFIYLKAKINGTMVSNKELQEKRMRGYFIAAASEILKGEGLRAVNVRSVSERAGYSFATLYNYFKDLNELIFICVNDFLEECEQMAEEQSQHLQPGKERLKMRMKALINYFTQYQGIFELCYIEKMNNAGSKQATSKMVYELTDRTADADITYMLNKKLLTDEEAEILKINLRHSLPGMMLFYLNRMQPVDYKDYMKIVNIQLDAALRNN